MPARSCPAFVTVAEGRQVRCNKFADYHGPDEDIHHGLLRVTLPDGGEHAASRVWSTVERPWDQANLRRAE